MSVALLETHDLTKLYGIVIGVNDMSVRLEPGVHGLLGPNGAGKSTLLKLVTAQLRPSEGRVEVFGEDPWNNPELFRRVGFCPEYDAFYSFMTAFEFVETLARVGGMRSAKARERAGAVLDMCGASEFMHRPISTYSKGMRQRTKVAQALVHEPQFVILDEPLTGTDPVGRHELTQLIRELGASGYSVLVASHVLHEVQAMTEEFLLIHGGRVLASGRVDEIRRLMDRYPHHIELRCAPGQARDLAVRMMRDLPVTGIEFDAATGRVSASTREPQDFFARLAELALDARIDLLELVSTDDSLETVFKYLVGAR